MSVRAAWTFPSPSTPIIPVDPYSTGNGPPFSVWSSTSKAPFLCINYVIDI